MARAYASTVIPSEVAEVWGFVRDFDNLPQWHPLITTSQIDPGPGGERGRADAIGCVRRLRTTDGALVVERLLRLDDVERSYTYSIEEGPFAVRTYVATIRCTPVTDSGQTFAEWWADFDADTDVEDDLRNTFGQDVFAAGLAALCDRFHR